MKRLIALLLTLVMALSLTMPASAASAKASTMRLMDSIGTTIVENAAGKNLSIKDNMRLYNGYEVATKDASYAYISLDSSKAVKLDASSAVKVNQSGKKLELDVTAGELMFNVPVALKSDESLNIRTSTMVTGIRGTAGWVKALDRYTTRVAVLEGAVTVNSQDPFTGADRAVTITGGQIATIIRHERAMAIQQQLIDDGVIIEDNIIAELTKPGQVVEELQEDDVPGFVAMEVAANDDLQDRMNEQSPLSVEEISKDAQKRQRDEEKASAQQKTIIEEQMKSVGSSDPGLPFAEPEVIIQTNTERVEVPGETITIPVGLNNPTTAEVQAVLDKAPNVAAITNVSPSRFDITELVMDSSDTLYILGGDLEISSEDTWTTNGYISILGFTEITNFGIVNMNDAVDLMTDTIFNNYGTLNINDSVYVDGIIINSSGTISVNNELLVMKNGIIDNQGGSTRTTSPAFIVSNAGSFLNSGLFYNNSSISNGGSIQNKGSFYNNAHFENTGVFVNGPYLNAESTGLMMEDDSVSSLQSVMLNKSSIENFGSIENYGSFYNNYSYSGNFSYSILNHGFLQNYQYFYNSGTIHAESTSGTAAIEMYSGTLEMNYGSITAASNDIALYYSNGKLCMEDSTISHEGSGTGYAVYFAGETPSSLLNNNSFITSDSLPNLIGMDNSVGGNPTVVQATTCYEEGYNYYYDDFIGDYYKYEQVAVDVIAIYNDMGGDLYLWRCFPCEVILDYNDEIISYSVDFGNIHEHEGGPC